MLPNLELLHTFAAVVKTGSQRAAARDRGLSVPTVSQHVHALEASLGVSLFERIGRRAVPTAEARELALRVSETLESIDAAVEDAMQAHRRVAGPLTIGSPRPFGQYWLTPRLGKVVERFPELVPTVRYGGPTMLEAAVREGSLDLAILVREPEQPGIEIAEIHWERFQAVASRAYLAGAGPLRTASDAQRHRWIAFDEDCPMLGRWWRGTFGGRARLPKIGAYVGEIYAMRSLAEAGVGIAALPDYTVAESLRQKRLVRVRSKGRDVRNMIALAWRSGLPASGRRAKVRDTLLSL
ncbi:MAG: LysR family transcriptional regulator [Myxococcota bacterium]